MVDPPEERAAVEERLRIRVEDAMAELRRANEERRRLLAISVDAGNTSDGRVALQQAIRTQGQAAERLRDALAAFSAVTRSTL